VVRGPQFEKRCFMAIAFQTLLHNWRVQVNQDGLKFNGTHQLLICADNVYTRILGGIVHTIKKNTGALLVASKEMSRD